MKYIIQQSVFSGCTLNVFIADVNSEEFVEKNKIHVPLSSTLRQLKERLAMVCFFSFCKRLGVGFVCLYLDFLHTVLKHLCFTIRKDTRHVRFCYSVSNMTCPNFR